jgi:hypothetical protein
MSANSLIKIAKRLSSEGVLASVVHASASNTVVGTGPTGGAEIRRLKDNKLFRSVVETPNIKGTQFIKHLVSICEQVEDALGEDCYVYWHGTKFVVDNGALKSANTTVKNFQNKHAFATASGYEATVFEKLPAGLKADLDSVCGVLGFMVKTIEQEASKGKLVYTARFLVPRLGTAERELRNITPSQLRHARPEVAEAIADALERIDVLQTLIRDKYNAECETQEIKIKTAKAMLKAIIAAICLK